MLCVKIHIKLWSLNLVEKAHLGVLCVGGTIILNFILKDTDLDAYDRDQ